MSSVSKADTDGTNRDIGGEEAFLEKADIRRFCLLPTASSGRREGDKIALTSKFPCCHDPICAIRGQSFFTLSESEALMHGCLFLAIIGLVLGHFNAGYAGMGI